jgi:hypothetical protein
VAGAATGGSLADGSSTYLRPAELTDILQRVTCVWVRDCTRDRGMPRSWSSERALYKLFKPRLDSKMKRWPQQDGDKVQTIGFKLLKMLLYEMESRSVGMGENG